MTAKRDARLDLLAGIDLFHGLSRRDLLRIASLSTEISLPEGSVLCREGQRALEAFILVEGSVAVSSDGRPVAMLRPGTAFGEIAMLDNKPRNATVVATSQVSVLVLTPQELSSVLDLVPALGRQLRVTAQERKTELEYVLAS